MLHMTTWMNSQKEDTGKSGRRQGVKGGRETDREIDITSSKYIEIEVKIVVTSGKRRGEVE